MYRYIAHDPFFRKGYSQYVDDPRLRYRRILVPLFAWILAFGQDAWIDYTYSAIVLLSIFAGCYWLARLFEQQLRSAWLGLLFLLVPATLASFDRLLIDATLVACFAGYLFYIRSARFGPAILLAALALFTRETGGILVVVLFLTRRYWQPAAVLLGYGVWSAFVWTHTQASGAAAQVVSYPLFGHLQRLLTPREVPIAWQRPILITTDALAMIGLLVSLGLTAYLLRSEPSRPIRVCVWLFIALALILSSPSHLEDPFGWARPISPIFLYLLHRCVADRRPAWLLAPAAVTLGVAVNFGTPLLGILRH